MPRTPDRDTVIKAMKSLDLCMMVTLDDGGNPISRPMSNNAQVDWDGDNWFFSNGGTRKVAQIEADDRMTLEFQGDGLWLSLRGRAVLHRDKAMFAERWTADLDQWFEEGIDTPGLTLIQVTAAEAEVWGRPGDGIVTL